MTFRHLYPKAVNYFAELFVVVQMNQGVIYGAGIAHIQSLISETRINRDQVQNFFSSTLP